MGARAIFLFRYLNFPALFLTLLELIYVPVRNPRLENLSASCSDDYSSMTINKLLSLPTVLLRQKYFYFFYFSTALTRRIILTHLKGLLETIPVDHILVTDCSACLAKSRSLVVYLLT